MGCGGSSDADNKKINADVKSCGLENIDGFFKDCGEFLKKAEGLRSSIEDPRDKMFELAKAEILKEPRLVDCVQAWLTACAVCLGNLDNVIIKMEEPYVELHLDACTQECKTFKLELQNFLQALKDAPTLCQTLLEEGQKLSEDSVEKAKAVPGEAQGAKMSVKEIMTATNNTKNNCKNLANGMKKLGQIKDTVTQVQEDVKTLVNSMQATLKTCVDDAKKDETKKLPAQCIDYSTQLKKTKAELDKLNAQKKKKADAEAKKQEKAQQ